MATHHANQGVVKVLQHGEVHGMDAPRYQESLNAPVQGEHPDSGTKRRVVHMLVAVRGFADSA
ncbi:hypothetical protein LPH56_00700 [Xylella taiwanensis]|uniref:hypothetical protein n=1 Tax=Xylella taiwanensis TaxID=1444770 RepID=UPI001E5CFB37|nr:hypothetical protein [Xylella taiwanensis]MCD8456925.1 hypothetical protein [Xylella taiwanensis]UFN41588.1 hypothetical protein LPH57_01620 [Xylella taiwanensis]UFS49734.1 hypothetical protein LPH54_00695 [Xylella taiwanensis]UFS52023.1 hypothetical protein LPH56_00700 [Xylella taiwanensis]